MSESQVVSVAVLSNFCNLSERRCQQLAKEGVMRKDSRGEYRFLESISGYIRYLQDTYESEVPDNVTANTDEKVLDRLNKFEDYRRKKHANEIDSAQSVRKKDLLPFFRHFSKQVGREFDSVAPQIESTYAECPDCGTKMKLDGRGNERIRDTIARMKNHLHELHSKLKVAKSSS